MVGRGAYKPVIEIMDAALEAMEPQTVGLVSNFYDTYQSFKKGQEMSRYIVNTGMQEIQMEAATVHRLKRKHRKVNGVMNPILIRMWDRLFLLKHTGT